MAARDADLTTEVTARAQRIWDDYERDHDIAPSRGRVAAVDPDTGQVWIGDDALRAIDLKEADGAQSPVWFVRVGFDYLDTKGCR